MRFSCGIFIFYTHIYNICFAKQKWRGDTFTTESISPLIWCGAVNVYLYKKNSLNPSVLSPSSVFAHRFSLYHFSERNIPLLGIHLYKNQSQIVVGIRKTGAGISFPLAPPHTSIDAIQYDFAKQKSKAAAMASNKWKRDEKKMFYCKTFRPL